MKDVHCLKETCSAGLHAARLGVSDHFPTADRSLSAAAVSQTCINKLDL